MEFHDISVSHWNTDVGKSRALQSSTGKIETTFIIKDKYSPFVLWKKTSSIHLPTKESFAKYFFLFLIEMQNK